jgi:hypothetical protein
MLQEQVDHPSLFKLISKSKEQVEVARPEISAAINKTMRLVGAPIVSKVMTGLSKGGSVLKNAHKQVHEALVRESVGVQCGRAVCACSVGGQCV